LLSLLLLDFLYRCTYFLFHCTRRPWKEFVDIKDIRNYR
jgi:hypothetical protein